MSDAQEYNAEQEATSAYPAIVVTLIALVITAVHSYKFYQDFFTKERLSVQHRRTKPVFDWAYNKSSYLTLLTLYCYTGALISWAVLYSATHIERDCGLLALSVPTFFVLAAKACLYLTYIFRLHQIYGPSAYGYSPKKLACIAATSVICIIALFALTVVGRHSATYYIDTDDKFPYHCSKKDGEPWLTIMGISMFLFELVAAITAIWGFSRPLKKVVTALENTMSVKNVLDKHAIEAKKRNQKILYSGYKYKVLVICASLTTFIWVIAYMVGLNTVGSVLMFLDYVINPVCLLLMTSYYPSDRYYERLCYLCVCCCDPQKKSYQSQASAPRASITGKSVTNAKSVDTSRAVHHAPSAPTAEEAAQSGVESEVQLTVDLNKTDANEVTPEPQASADVTPKAEETQNEENASA